MGSQERDVSRIEVQITVAKWHLHEAMRVAAHVAVHKLECARLAYAGIVRSLSEAKLTKKERRRIEREVGVLKSRLEGGPVLPGESAPARRNRGSSTAG